MFKTNSHTRRRVMPLAVSLCALLCGAPALAQSGAQGAADQAGAPAGTADKKEDAKKPSLSQAKPSSPNATINLVNMLVKQGVLKEEQAQELIKQADDEAYVARQAAKDAGTKADEAAKAASAATAAANPPGTRHVTYVPEIVKRELREQIKQEVMAKAEKENWASPGAYPEWAQRIRFSGDLRLRYQGDFFPSGNDQADAWDYNGINTGAPYDVSQANVVFPPTYNASQNRELFRFRARMGLDADLYNGFSAGMRIATGDTATPVSTNQTFGGSGGNFSKYAVWLDRGFLKYQAWGDDLVLSAGRFDNPFWSPTDLVWYRELGFDGVAVQAKQQLFENFSPFAVGGAFPIFNTALNTAISLDSGAGGLAEVPSHDKWMFGGQAGFTQRFNPQSSFRFAVAYYDFDNVQGQVSSPCFVQSASDACDTDLTRPSFAQKGNTYMPLRNIVATPANNFGEGPGLYEYFGLVGQYRPVVASGQLDFGDFHPVHIVLDGEYVVNTAFDRNLMNGPATINNRAPDIAPGVSGPYNGGNQGWLGRLTVGDKEIKHFGDWNAHVGYKYLESDATLDAFADSDFGLGGTNLKGYFLGANYGLADNVWTTFRWMSANNIAGVPYAVDVLQVDLNAKF